MIYRLRGLRWQGPEGRVTLEGNNVVMWPRAEDERNRKVSGAEQWQSSLVCSGASERIGPHCWSGSAPAFVSIALAVAGVNTILSIWRQAGIEHSHWRIVSQSVHPNGLALLICVSECSLMRHLSNWNLYQSPSFMRKLNPLLGSYGALCCYMLQLKGLTNETWQAMGIDIARNVHI